MARKTKAHEISVNLFLDRRLWQTARYFNAVLGPGYSSVNMNNWVNMLLARYVHAQLNDPTTKARLEKHYRHLKETSNHYSSRILMQDADVVFWKEDGDERAETTGQQPAPSPEKPDSPTQT